MQALAISSYDVENPRCPPPKRVNILGVGISAIDLDSAVEAMACWIEQRQHGYVVLATVYTIMMCQRDDRLRALVNRAALITPDGMPLVWLARWFGFAGVDRVYGPDLLLRFSQMALEHGYSFFFYGGTDGVADALADELSDKFPGLHIAGTFSPPFRDLTELESDVVIQQINDAAPDVIWVGLGSPKQDYWVAQHRERLNAPVLIGIGAAFDIHAGRLRQAPRWMRRSGLEWLFRLSVEPRRLWRRYLIYNPKFVAAILLQVLGIRRVEIDAVEPAHTDSHLSSEAS